MGPATASMLLCTEGLTQIGRPPRSSSNEIAADLSSVLLESTWIDPQRT
jgi:hypothetical protein